MARIEMNNAGTVFHNGPVVQLIVDNLPLEDKVNLLRQIEEEDEFAGLFQLYKKRPPESTIPMSGWKEAIERALTNQQVISHYIDRYRTAEKFNRWDICFTRHDFTDATNVIPDQWLAKEEEFERLLLLCPNLTGIHLIVEQCDNLVNILNMILRLAPNLTSFTFVAKNGSREGYGNEFRTYIRIIKKLSKIIRDRRGKMEYISTSFAMRGKRMKEWIERNPNLTAIQTGTINVDFVKKHIHLDGSILITFKLRSRIVELCEFFKTFNSHYKMSSSNGVKLNGIIFSGSLTDAIVAEIVNSFQELEFLSLTILEANTIRRLQVMRNLKALTVAATVENKSQALDELLPHLVNLSELRIEFGLIFEATLCQLHILCPHLRKLTVRHDVGSYEKLPALREICKLAELEYFEYQKPDGYGFIWPNRNTIEEKRRAFNDYMP